MRIIQKTVRRFVPDGISDKIQLILANDIDTNIRVSLARNPRVSKEAQLILARSPEIVVRVDLACNNNISEEPQLILANDNDC